MTAIPSSTGKKEPQIIVKAVHLQGTFEYSPDIAINWFTIHLKNDPLLQRAFRTSLYFPGIIHFIDWAGIRGYLKEKQGKGQGQVRGLTKKEAEAKGVYCLRVETPDELWKKAIGWMGDYSDSSFEWIMHYSQHGPGIIVFIAWCLEHGYLKEKEAAQ